MVTIQGKINSKSFTQTNGICHGYFNVDWANDITQENSHFDICVYFIFNSYKLD
jgi:hypothetical protein